MPTRCRRLRFTREIPRGRPRVPVVELGPHDPRVVRLRLTHRIHRLHPRDHPGRAHHGFCPPAGARRLPREDAHAHRRASDLPVRHARGRALPEPYVEPFLDGGLLTLFDALAVPLAPELRGGSGVGRVRHRVSTAAVSWEMRLVSGFVWGGSWGGRRLTCSRLLRDSRSRSSSRPEWVASSFSSSHRSTPMAPEGVTRA